MHTTKIGTVHAGRPRDGNRAVDAGAMEMDRIESAIFSVTLAMSALITLVTLPFA